MLSHMALLTVSNRLLEENLQHLKTAHDQLVQSEKLAALGPSLLLSHMN